MMTADLPENYYHSDPTARELQRQTAIEHAVAHEAALWKADVSKALADSGLAAARAKAIGRVVKAQSSSEPGQEHLVGRWGCVSQVRLSSRSGRLYLWVWFGGGPACGSEAVPEGQPSNFGEFQLNEIEDTDTSL